MSDTKVITDYSHNSLNAYEGVQQKFIDAKQAHLVEEKSNKKGAINNSSTEYPNSKAVLQALDLKQDAIDYNLNSVSASVVGTINELISIKANHGYTAPAIPKTLKEVDNELKPSTWRDKGTMSPQYKAAIEELLSMFDFTNSNDFTISDDKGNVIFKIDADGVKLPTKWTGKKIGWYGGSNLKGGNDNISYVNYATERVGALYYNYALGGATQKLFMSDGTPMPKSRRIKAFSILLSEIDTLLSDATEAEKAIAIAQSFETTLIPHANEYDLFMFGYGLNDCEVDKTGSDSWLPSSEFVKFDPLDPRNPDKFPIFSRDRSSYIGATNFVIDRLLEANPRARFGFMGHFSKDDAQYFSTQHERLTIIQNSLAEYWGVGICRPYERTGWICKDGINTISEFCPDDIHAYKDPSGQALEILVKITTDFLLNECTEIF